MIFCWFFWLSLVPPIKKMGEITFWWRNFPGHTVTFGSQLGKRQKNQNFQAELPGNWTIRVRIIGAEVSSFDPSGQVVTQRWDCLPDFLTAFLMHLVTAERARSAPEEVLRSLPPSPTAEARWSAIACNSF